MISLKASVLQYRNDVPACCIALLCPAAAIGKQVSSTAVQQAPVTGPGGRAGARRGG